MHLLPMPRTLTPQEGSFSLTPKTRLVAADVTGELAHTGLDQLCEDINRYAGYRVSTLRGDALSGDIGLSQDASLPAQGYRIVISPDRVAVSGGDDAGLLHGVQTVRQLFRQFGSLLPAMTIEDDPAFPNRGYYLDVTRGRIPTLASLKRLADEACLYKLNQLQLYVEHTYLFNGLSEMWRIGETLTAGEIMELDTYCAARGIELVPSIASFGHLFELLSTKSYRDLCELTESLPSAYDNRMHHHTLNAADPRSLALAKRMIGEFMPLFRSRQFNLCADETFDLGKGRSAAHMAAVGEQAYYIGFVKELCEFVVSQKRKPMFWGDIVARFPAAVGVLPAGTVCLNWGYNPEQTEDETRALAQAGAVQYVCPGVCGWNEWMNRLPDSYENIRRMAEYGLRYGAIGLLNTDWGDYGHINDPLFSLPGLIYGAVHSWQQQTTPMAELNKTISFLAYGDSSLRVVDLLAALQDRAVYSWRALVQYKEFCQGAYPNGQNVLVGVPAGKVSEQNRLLENTLHELRACATTMDTSSRSIQQGWWIACEAIRLWNLVGETVANRKKAPELAAELEHWFVLYHTNWRETCRESEVWRIRDMVCWYADRVREG